MKQTVGALMRIGLLLFFLVSFATGRSEDAITIYFYQRGYVAGGSGAATQLTDAAVAAFERSNPRVDVEIVGLPWMQEGELKLRSVLLSRRKIDCFRASHDQLAHFVPRRGRLLAPVGPRLSEADRRDFGAATLEAVSRDGEILAWPLWSTALSLIGNREIMDRRGIEPTPPGEPWSWQQFLSALERATFEDDKTGPVYGLTAAARPPLFEWSPLLFAHAGSIFAQNVEAEGWRFAPGLADALERVAELPRRGLTPPAFGIDDQIAAQNQFLQGRAAFILSSPGFIRTLAERSFPYVILPPPLGASGEAITTGGLGCFAVVDHPENPQRTDAAHALARYLTSAEIAEDVPGWYLAIPARRSVKGFAENPAYRGLEEIARTAVYLKPPADSGFIEGTLIPGLQGVLIGETEPAPALRAIRERWERQSLEQYVR